MTAETAAALFWWIRNGLYFEIGLDRRDDVLLASYQDMLATPVEAMQSICTFLGLEYRPALIEHISPRGPGSPRPIDIDPRVRALCDHLQRPPRRSHARPARRRRRPRAAACSAMRIGVRPPDQHSDRAIFRQSGLTGVAAMAGVIAGLILDVSIAFRFGRGA